MSLPLQIHKKDTLNKMGPPGRWNDQFFVSVFFLVKWISVFSLISYKGNWGIKRDRVQYSVEIIQRYLQWYTKQQHHNYVLTELTRQILATNYTRSLKFKKLQ